MSEMAFGALSRLQFEKERELATFIKQALPGDRPRAYYEAYKELYELFPDIATDDAEETHRVETTLGFLDPLLGDAKLVVEVGAGRCYLAKGLATRAEKVIAVDVTLLGEPDTFPPNLEHRVFDGRMLELESNSADCVLSDNVFEHVHPDDALMQLKEMVRVTKPGGYIPILTPNAVNGPHDISAFFSRKPEGLHLKEYTSMEMKRMYQAAGCVDSKAYIGAKGRYVALPSELAAVVEFFVGLLPRKILRLQKVRWLLPNRFSARKPAA